MKSPGEAFPARVLAFADRHGMLPAGSTLLCALSGGGDSMALLTCLLAVAADRDLTILAAHYDHQLRGEASRRDAAFVTRWCRAQGVPLTVGRGDVAARAAREGKGIEETARAMRYAFLEETAQAVGADGILTAHNADDNAETLLLHLVRGTGLDGLTGIPPKRGKLLRPLLTQTRAEIEAYLAAMQVPFCQDSSNDDPAYARNRIRRDVMPVLRALNPSFSHRLAANLAHIQADRALLEQLAREALTPQAEGRGLALPARALADLPRPLASRVVKQTLAALGRHQISAVHLEAILALAGSGPPAGRCALPQGLSVRRVYDRLLFAPDAALPPPLSPVTIPAEGTYTLGPWRLDLRRETCPADAVQGPFQWFLRAEAVALPLTARARATGDRLRLPGRAERSLKKWYIDEKIPRQDRDTLPVLTDAHGLAAAAGLGPDQARIAAPGEAALHITLTETERT